MKVKVLSKMSNPLLKRKEVAFKVEHSDDRETPSRFEVRQKLASNLKVNLELVYIEKVETKTGTMTAMGEANVYESVEQAKLLEPGHIVARNAPQEKSGKESREEEAEG